MLRQCLLLSALAFVGLLAVSALAQNIMDPAAAKFFDDAVVRNGLADHQEQILRGRNRQVNESGGVGWDSRGWLALYRRYTQNPSASAMA